MFRFTIRDLLWLMVVVGCLCGWAAHYVHWHRVDGGERRVAWDSYERVQAEHQELRRRLTALWNDYYGPLHNSKELYDAMHSDQGPKISDPRVHPPQPATSEMQQQSPERSVTGKDI
jgi:hypothetical protein